MSLGWNDTVSNIGVQDEPTLEERPASPQMRLLVVDDHEAFRRFVCSTIRAQTNLQVVGEPQDGLQAVQVTEELQPDIVLLDIGLPGMNGLDAARQIGKIAPKARIIFLTQESSHDVVEEAFNRGAWGYVHKTQAGSELLDAINAVGNGRRFLSSSLNGTGSHPNGKR